ncbi:MAG: hypothetical protein GY906_29335, partial [bacterium]|nr:hypothetical protein [bacterium]
VWGGVALILLDHTNPLLWICAIVLLLPALLIQPIFRVLDRCSVRLLGHRGARGRWWAHRIRSVRLSLDSVSRSRGRFTIAAVSSVLMWGSVWLYTWLLVQGIGYQWKFSVVFTGACGAAAANIIPVSLIANVGTLEAGWTAVLVTLGIHVQDAAASGVAIHFWGLVFAAIFGSLGWAAVQLHGSETES